MSDRSQEIRDALAEDAAREPVAYVLLHVGAALILTLEELIAAIKEHP